MASLHAGPATAGEVDLSFLPAGRSYRATIVADDLTTSERTVTAADTLTVPLAADGGFIVRLRP